MWTINGLDVINYGRTGEGRRFTELVDAIIRVQARISGVLASDIHTSLRTNLADGGVDTQVDAAAVQKSTLAKASDDATSEIDDWMSEKTIWQFKATDFRSATGLMNEEVNKPYAKARIKEGYAYRFCICDDVPAQDKLNQQTALNKLVRAINPHASEAKILLASDIAAWGSRFPALVLRFFRQPLEGRVLHLDAWSPNVLGRTPNYVSVPAWKSTQDDLHSHLDLRLEVPDPVFPLQGEAGVGKTRLVYEVVKDLEGMSSLLLYATDDRHARDVARAVANDTTVSAVIIADECSLQARVELASIVRGHGSRVRVVAIDNSGDILATGAPEPLLQHMPQDVLEAILASNFSRVPQERRRAYADLAGGFVRLAADMCAHDVRIAAARHVGPVVQSIQQYVATRFPDEQELQVVQALALVDRIGFKEDVSHELDLLCAALKLDRQRTEQIAARLHDIPGFVAQAGRYFYVTPEIIAQIAFDGAWARWVARDPTRFFATLPTDLTERVYQRVMRSAGEEVRSLVGGSFRRWAAGLTVGSLAEIASVDRLVMLVDTDPAYYLPLLRRLITEATLDELRQITGHSLAGRWGSRRSLVWLADRVAAFPEFFADAEVILRKLALAESEPNISNNATGSWKQLFRIVLSGTATPFQSRLELLQKILSGQDEQEALLAASAVDTILNTRPTRTLGPAVVVGRIPPPEWRPATQGEMRDCYSMAVSLVGLLLGSDRDALRSQGFTLITKYLRHLLASEYLEQVQTMLASLTLSESGRLSILGGIEDFLRFQGDPKRDQTVLEEGYIAKVREWQASLQPTDLHGRLVQIVGVKPWRYHSSRQEEKWTAALSRLALELLENPSHLHSEIEWLMTPEAQSAGVLGREIGLQDEEGRQLVFIMEKAREQQATAFARGYIAGLLEANPDQATRVNAFIDKTEALEPEFAFDLFIVGGEATHALERTLRLTDANRLAAGYLQAFIHGGTSYSLNHTQIKEILHRLVRAAENGDRTAADVGVDLVASRLDRDETISQELGKEPLRGLIWQLLTAAAPLIDTGSGYWWNELLKFMLPFDPDKAANLIVRVIFSDNFSLQDELAEASTMLARQYPKILLDNLLPVLRDDELRWHFFVGSYKYLISALPANVVAEWLAQNEPSIAVSIARHLPVPYLDQQGKPVVPEITEAVLKLYEDNDALFHEFVAGAHSMQVYSGDIAALHEHEANVARLFADHPVKRIREWAVSEEEASLQQAAEWRRRKEEDRFH